MPYTIGMGDETPLPCHLHYAGSYKVNKVIQSKQMSFSKFKGSAFAALQKELESSTEKGGGSNAPTNEWKPTPNKEKTGGGAIVRLLPGPDGVPFVKLFTHMFQGPEDDWYAENCPTTLGGDCPVCKANREIYKNNTKEVAQKLAAGKSRKKKYISNVYVVKDPMNPEAEGKVFLWRYGQQIFDVIQRAMYPDESLGDEPIDVFDVKEGANLRIRITYKGQYPNYESSTFADPTALSMDDDELDEIFNQLHPISPIVEPSQFKSYDELEARFTAVTNPQRRASVNQEASDEIDEELDWAAPSAPAPEPVAAPVTSSSSTEEEDAFAFFNNIASKDVF